MDMIGFDLVPEEGRLGPSPDISGTVAEGDPLGGTVRLAGPDDLSNSVVLIDEEVQ